MKLSASFSIATLACFLSCYVNASQTVSYTYNQAGQVLTQDGPRTDVSDVTTNTYNDKGLIATTTNSLGHVTTYNNYDANGNLLSVTDANGITTEFTYDERGWLLSSRLRHPTTPSLDALTIYTYDAVGQMLSTTLPNNVKIFYEYDGGRRLIAAKNAANERIEYTLDTAGNRTQQVIKDASGAITYSLNTTFDELNRVMKVIGNNGQQYQQQYDSNDNHTVTIDGRTNTNQKTYDALNRVKKVIDPNLGTTQLSYNAQDQIKTVTDARGNVTTYSYDGLGNLTSEISPDTGTTTFTYDAAGNRLSQTDARGVTTHYTYDALNRLKSVSYPAASAENVTYGYDDITSGVWGMNYGVGRMTSVTNSVAITTYKYNEAGLIKMKRAAVNGITLVTSYSYDAANNLASITYPSGRIVTYVRDSDGRVQSVKTKLNASAPEQTVISGITYLPFGPANNYTFGNGLNHIAYYDKDYRLSSIQVGGIVNRSYGYDAVDNITAINDIIANGKNQTFTYDALNRLTNATGIYGALAYTYDAVGNRLSEKTDKDTTHLNDIYIYPATSNRLASITKTKDNLANGTRNFMYDNAGNLTQGTAENNQLQEYTYNNANRLTTTKVTNALVGTYTYNALGQRVIKAFANGSKELYQYNESSQLIAVTDATGRHLREYIYNGEQLVGFINMDSTGNSGSSTSSSSSSHSNSFSSASSAASIAAIKLDETTATFVGSHGVGSGFAGFTGSGFIDYNGEGQIDWPLTITISANYTITLRYALAGSASRPLALWVDGEEKATFTTAPTTSWTTWTTESKTISLPAGSHTLSLKTTGQSGPNVDKLDIVAVVSSASASNSSSISSSSSIASSAASIAAIKLDETTATFVGSHAVGSGFAGFTGSGFIDYNGEGQIDWPLTIATSANYTVTLRYALAGSASRPLALWVDGEEKATFTIAATTSWTTWTTESKTISLPAGSHTLSLKTTGQSGPNVDKLDIVAAASSSTQTPVATLYFVHTDYLGTPHVVTDQHQSVVYMADYQPFGKLQTGQPNSIELYSRFPGQYLDHETGLYYNYFRDYDPSIGRYIESDPIGLEGGINTYAYVNGNPISNVDPLGLAQMCHRPIQGYVIPGRHCFIKYEDGSTDSFTPTGVDKDLSPNNAVCTDTKEEEKNEDCIKKEMKKCDGYNFTKNNCCHCAEQALNACGQSIPTDQWPNWPINPGPQPGEPGAK